MDDVTRRGFVGSMMALFHKPGFAAPARDEWAELPAILERIQPPVFPDRQFDITRYGAIGDSATDCTAPIHDAISACSRAGGGSVIVPAGVFLTGAVHLESNVDLHISSGATLRFGRDPRMYLPVVFSRFEGVECMNYSPFIYAYEQTNLAVTGEGVLDGQADCAHWWPWKGKRDCGWKNNDPNQAKDRQELMDLAERDVPVEKRVFGAGHYLRPQFIQPYKCRNVLIEGITIRNSPMYEVHPVLCRNVIVRGVKIESHGPNNDGCDPESSTDVLIEGCQFETGDDCIAIKSGRNRDGRRVGVPCENVVIRGCRMKDGHGGVTIGSEISGGARNIFVDNCEMDSPHLNEAIRFKNNAMRGGVIERVRVRNVRVGQVSDAAIQVDLLYEEGARGPYRPIVRDVEIRNLSCGRSQYVLYLRGFAAAEIRDIRLDHCTFEHVAKPDIVESVEGLRFEDVTVNGKKVKPA